jgi:hypothetical protein
MSMCPTRGCYYPNGHAGECHTFTTQKADTTISEEELRRLRITIAEAKFVGVLDGETCDKVLRVINAELSRRSQGNDAAGDVQLPMGMKRVDDQRLREIMSGYADFPAPDYFETSSLAHEVRNWRMSTPTASQSRQAADVQAQGEDLHPLLAALNNTVCLAYPGYYAALHALNDALLQRQPSKPKAEAWQPIESAPRDGSSVLVGYYDWEGVWRTHEAWWRMPYESAPAKQCWWCYGGDTTLLSADVHSSPTGKKLGATHWQPMPAPPKRTDAQKEKP